MYDIQQKLIRDKLKRLASSSLELPHTIVENSQVEGAVRDSDILPFQMQQKISSTGTANSNVILAGDSAGNNYWSVVGGMQVGGVSHI